LPRSLRLDNLPALLRTAIRNGSLVRYLMSQGLQSMEDRMRALREYYPKARAEHWRLVPAGIRVQAIRKQDRGALYFGTEVLSAADRSLAALLGASPGASVSVNIALEVVQTCLPQLLASVEGRERMLQMIPTFDIDLKQPGHATLFEKSTREASEQLQLVSRP
jgi:malate dehydrogenase (quinone)